MKYDVFLFHHDFFFNGTFNKQCFFQKSSDLWQGLSNQGLLTKSGLHPVFKNKMLLEHSHAHLFTYCPQLLLHYDHS